MRIAMDARYLSKEFSGIGNYCENLIRHLVPLDPENQYSSFVHESFDRDLDLPDNAEIIPSRSRPVSLHTLFGFGRAVSDTGADLLHSLFPIAPLFLKIPSIVTVHDLQALIVPEFTGRRFFLAKKAYDLFYRWTYPRTIRRARWLIADSYATRRDLGRLIPESRSNTMVVYSGLDPSVAEPVNEAILDQVAEKYKLPERYVLYIGSTRPNKNLPNMIQAFHFLREKREDMKDLFFVLVVAADRFFEDSRKIIRKRRLQKRMRVYKQISEREKLCFFAQAEALMLVTKYEGFGLPLIEAQTCGVPVLAGNHASLPEIANDTALLVDPDNPRQIANQLHRLLTDTELRRDLVEKGRVNAARFRWEKAAQAIRDMYHHLL